jgi:uncharacterized membrane protein
MVTEVACSMYASTARESIAALETPGGWTPEQGCGIRLNHQASGVTAKREHLSMATRVPHRKAQRAAVLLGIGLGGFVDGIVLHQIVQWHHMLSNWMPPTTMEAMQRNTLWDGLFHALVWLVTLLGVFLLWSAAYHQERIPFVREFVGRLLFGWGWFNLVEGLIDHQLLGVHYVRQVANSTVYNMTFLAIGGVGLILVGWILMRTGRRDVIEV